MSLLDKIKAGSNYKKDTVWPGTEAAIKLRVLNEQDYNEATLATDKLFRETKIGMENISRYDGEVETQCLFRSIEDSETGGRITNNITEFRKLLTPEIKDMLATELDALQEEFSPDPVSMPDEEFDKLIHDVKKNSTDVLKNITGIFLAKRVIKSLVSQPSK